jgi:hypothetical protein
VLELAQPERETPASYLNGNGAAPPAPPAAEPQGEESPMQREAAEAKPEQVTAETPMIPEPPRPRGTKRGWWQRRV